MPGLVATRNSTRSRPLARSRPGWGSSPPRAGAAHRQLVELGGDPLLELPRRLRRARSLSSAASSARLLAAARARRSSSSAALLGALDPLDLRAAALGVGQHGLDRAAVLALQPVDHVEALLDLLEAPGLGLDPVGVGAQLGAQLA